MKDLLDYVNAIDYFEDEPEIDTHVQSEGFHSSGDEWKPSESKLASEQSNRRWRACHRSIEREWARAFDKPNTVHLRENSALPRSRRRIQLGQTAHCAWFLTKGYA